MILEDKIKAMKDSLWAWLLVFVALVAMAALVSSMITWASREIIDERLETISDSTATNKISIERIEGQLDELHVQDSLIALSVAASKARVVVLRQKLAKPEITPFKDASEAKEYLLQKIQSQESK